MMEEKTNLQFNKGVIVRTLVNFIIPLICLGVSIILGLVVIYPYFKNKPAVDAQISEKQKLNQTLEGKIIILNKLSEFKVVLTESSQLVDKVLVSEANVPQLLDEIFQIATNVGMAVTRLNYSYGEAKTGTAETGIFQEVNVSLGAEGGYDQLIAFLQSTEIAARVLYVPTFRYSVSEDGEMSMNFSIISPFLFVQSSAVTDDPVALDVTNPSFIDFINKLKPMKYYEFLNKDIKVIEEEPATTTP
jgi:Tfp pilus assembly protein PilO